MLVSEGRKNKVMCLFFIPDTPFPPAFHFSFTTDSELMWAQETWNISAYRQSAKKRLPSKQSVQFSSEHLLVQTFGGIWKEKIKINCMFAKIIRSLHWISVKHTSFHLSSLNTGHRLNTHHFFIWQFSFYKTSQALAAALTKSCREVPPTANAELAPY